MNIPATAIPVLPIALTVIAMIVVLLVVRKALGASVRKQSDQMQTLMATGKKARAKILRIDPLRLAVNDINIHCRVTFLLEPLDGSPAFEASKKMFLNQTQMPRAGDIWPSWVSQTDPSLFVVAMPDGASPEQIPVFREFGIPHPLDPPTTQARADDDPVEDLQALAKLKTEGLLTDEEFTAAKARLLGNP